MDEIERMAEEFRKDQGIDIKKDNIEGRHFWKDYSEPDMVVSSQELWETLKDQKVRGFRIPQFPELDNLLGGFQEGEIITISGLTKHGKTCLCQSFTRSMAENGIKSLWFTYEIPERQFLSFMSENDTLPIFYMPQQLKSKDLAWFENRIKEAIVKYQVSAIFIDHLHYLADMTLKNLTPEMGKIMRFLKQDIAIKYGLVVFLLVHMSKVDTDEEPDASNIRDSALIPAESDVVLIMLRLKEDNRANLKVEFTRRTGVFKKKIQLIKKKYFEEINEDEPKEEHNDKWWNNKNINLPYKNGGDEE